MNRMHFALFPHLILCGLLTVGLPASLMAQETGTARIKLATNSAAPVRAQKTVVQRKKPTVPANRPQQQVSRTTGGLSVASESGATVFIQPLGATDFIDKETIEANKAQAIFDNLTPGKYRVVAEKDGFVDAENQITVVAAKTADLNLRLKPELYTVKIRTNIATADVNYRPLNSTEPPRTAPLTNNVITLSGLLAGKIEVNIKPADAAYPDVLDTIEVGTGKTEFEVILQRQVCEETFSEAWLSLEGWNAPATWKTVARKLSLTGVGIGLPKANCPRHFQNVELTSDLRLLNDVGVGFALRARDAKNYYLVQINGSKAAEPLTMRGYAVINGQKQPLGGPIPIDAFAPNITGKYFTVVLQIVDHKITVSVNDSESGDTLPLGQIPDPSKHFAVGAIGLVGSGAEQNEISRVVAKPLVAPIK